METGPGANVPGPSFARGGGQRLLRLAALAVYGITWSLLLVGLLLDGEWVGASLMTALLVGLWRLPTDPASPRGWAVGGVAAMTAGMLWGLEPVVETLAPGALGRPWPWIAASLLLLLAIPGVRSVEVHVQQASGPVFSALGFLPVFLSAAIAGNVLAPIAGVLVTTYAALGTLLLVITTVPFAIVAAWTRAVPRLAAAILVLGAVLQTALGVAGAPLSSPLLAGAAVVYGAGWVAVGASLLRVRNPLDEAAAS
jgi:hypothetical protein